jgi:hypothetical protein
MRVINRNFDRWNDGVGAYMGATIKRKSTRECSHNIFCGGIPEDQVTSVIMIKSDVQDLFRKNALPPFSGSKNKLKQ